MLPGVLARVIMCRRLPTVGRSCKRAKIESMPRSAVVANALEAIGSGRSHVHTARQSAAAAVADGAQAQAAIALATLSETQPCHLERDLHRWLRHPFGLQLEPFMVKVKLDSLVSPELQEVELPMLLPHEVLHHVFKAGSVQWQRSFLGDSTVQSRQAFWEHIRSVDMFEDLPIYQHIEAERLHTALPLTVHTDGVEVFTNIEYNSWSLSCPFSIGDIMDKHMLLLVVPEAGMKTVHARRGVHKQVAEVLKWSFRARMHGIMPSVGPEGKTLTGRRGELALHPLCGGFRGVYFNWNADAKARWQCHNFSRNYMSNLVCDHCYAGKGSKHVSKHLYHGNYSPDAYWRRTLVSQNDYMASEPLVSYYSCIEGWRLSLVGMDFMHTMYLGIGRSFAASLLHDMRDLNLLPDGLHLEAQLALFNKDFVAWCHDHGLSKPRRLFTPANAGFDTEPHKTPEISTAFKAHTVKVVLYFLAAYLSRSCNLPLSTHITFLVTASVSLAKCIKTLDSAQLILTQEQAVEAHRAGYCFLEAVQHLRALSWENGKVRYGAKPKHHYLCHIFDFMLKTRLNPMRFAQVFESESFQNIIKTIGRMCHIRTACMRLFQRYILNLAGRFQASKT